MVAISIEISTPGAGALMNSAITDIGALSGEKDMLQVLMASTLQIGVQLFAGAAGHGGLDIEGGGVPVRSAPDDAASWPIALRQIGLFPCLTIEAHRE